MKTLDRVLSDDDQAVVDTADRLLDTLITSGDVRDGSREPQTGVLVGTLLGMQGTQASPLVTYPGQPGSAAVAARSVIDLSSADIGKSVVLMFENADPMKPLIMGVLRSEFNWPSTEGGGQVRLDVDGAHMVVSAKEQLTLRCGEASVTLTKAGKILIKGTYVLSSSSGLNRIKGGSVHIN
jgi:hypothetical protein